MSLEAQALVIRSIISHTDQAPRWEASQCCSFLYLCFFQGIAFSEGNTNLSLWEAAVGSSYMCNKEQNYTITSFLTLYTFNLQVQPFGVKKGIFSTGMFFCNVAQSRPCWGKWLTLDVYMFVLGLGIWKLVRTVSQLKGYFFIILTEFDIFKYVKCS